MGLARQTPRVADFNLFGGDTSLSLWLLAVCVTLLASQVGLAWLRLAQRRPGLLASWGKLLLAATALGCGICAAVLLTLAAEPWPFWLGYRSSAALLLWLGAVLGCLPIVLALSYKPRAAGLALCGCALSLLAGGLQAGWLAAAGLLPGPAWPLPMLATGSLLMAVGFAAALLLGLRAADTFAAQRGWLRFGAALVLGASLFAGQEMLMLGANLPQQKASAYAHDLPEHVMNMVGGAVVPTMLVLMACYLEVRRRQRRSFGGSDVAPPKRRKRRHRQRTL